MFINVFTSFPSHFSLFFNFYYLLQKFFAFTCMVLLNSDNNASRQKKPDSMESRHKKPDNAAGVECLLLFQ